MIQSEREDAIAEKGKREREKNLCIQKKGGIYLCEYELDLKLRKRKGERESEIAKAK